MSSGSLPSSYDFDEFFNSWLADQDRDLQHLQAAATATATSRPRSCEEEAEQERRLRPLLDAVISRYEHYYLSKEASARCDVLPMFAPTWTSSTENLFLWVGGWRPTMAVHLLYSKCGIQVESVFNEIINGASAQDFSDLDADQLRRVDELHRLVVLRERQISEEAAAAQETVADKPLVRLSRVITEMGGGGEVNMQSEMKQKCEAMRKVLEKADCLRIETLKGLLEILLPIQAVHFLIAAAELHLRVHDFGKMKDSASELARDPTPSPASSES